jgi:hypothetical protein
MTDPQDRRDGPRVTLTVVEGPTVSSAAEFSAALSGAL